MGNTTEQMGPRTDYEEGELDGPAVEKYVDCVTER